MSRGENENCLKMQTRHGSSMEYLMWAAAVLMGSHLLLDGVEGVFLYRFIECCVIVSTYCYHLVSNKAWMRGDAAPWSCFLLNCCLAIAIAVWLPQLEAAYGGLGGEIESTPS